MDDETERTRQLVARLYETAGTGNCEAAEALLSERLVSRTALSRKFAPFIGIAQR